MRRTKIWRNERRSCSLSERLSPRLDWREPSDFKGTGSLG